MRNVSLDLLVTAACLFLITPAASAQSGESVVREMSPAARDALKWFRAVGSHHVEHASHEVSRIRAQLGSDMLEQFVTADHAAYLYGVEVGGTPDLFGAIKAVQGSPIAPPYPNAIFPTVTPWVMVTRGETAPPASSDDAVPAGSSWYMTPARIQAWRARRNPRDERVVIAVGRRVMVGREREGSQLLRVQRFYRLRSMNQKVAVGLRPADADGAFRELDVVVNQSSGVFRWTGAGEVVGFRATTNALFVTTTALITRRISFNVEDGAVKFGSEEGRAADARDELRVISSLRAARVRPVEACAAKLTGR